LSLKVKGDWRGWRDYRRGLSRAKRNHKLDCCEGEEEESKSQPEVVVGCVGALEVDRLCAVGEAASMTEHDVVRILHGEGERNGARCNVLNGIHAVEGGSGLE